MHRKQHIQTLVYNNLFPNPRPEDPATFSAHLSKNLVGEVRIETATFYGSLDTVEARYPGLNYSHPPHRKRLGRFLPDLFGEIFPDAGKEPEKSQPTSAVSSPPQPNSEAEAAPEAAVPPSNDTTDTPTKDEDGTETPTESQENTSS